MSSTPHSTELDAVLRSFGAVRVTDLTQRFVYYPDLEQSFIAEGSFGKVHRVRPVNTVDGTPNLSEPMCACKVILKERVSKKSQQIHRFAAELACTGILEHENINKRVALLHNTTTIFILLELLDGPRPDVLTRVAHLLAHRAPNKLFMIDSLIAGWKAAAEADGIDAENDEEAFGDYVDSKKLIQSVAAVHCRMNLATIKPGQSVELAKGGDLYELLTARRSLSEPAARIVLRHVLLGLQYLHAQFIVSRDLKPENVALMSVRKSELKRDPNSGRITGVIFYEKIHAQIIDFGLAKFCCHPVNYFPPDCVDPSAAETPTTASPPSLSVSGPTSPPAASSSSRAAAASGPFSGRLNLTSSSAPAGFGPPLPSPGAFVEAINTAQEQVKNQLQHQQQQQQQKLVASESGALQPSASGSTVAPCGSCPQFPPQAEFDPFADANADALCELQATTSATAAANNNSATASASGFDQLHVSLSPGVGSEIYRAFESIEAQITSKSVGARMLAELSTVPKADIFGAGACLFYMLQGRAPFVVPKKSAMTTEARLRQLAALIEQGPRFEGHHISESAQSLCKKMLSADHAQRPTAAQALENDRFVNHNCTVVRTEIEATGAGKVALQQDFPPHIATQILEQIATAKRNDFPTRLMLPLLRAALPKPMSMSMRTMSSEHLQQHDSNEEGATPTGAMPKAEGKEHFGDSMEAVRRHHDG